MKTPKRDYKNPADKFPGDIEPDSWEADYQMQDSRWKRKNRVKQLKRTIARLTQELQNEREKSSFFYVAYSSIAEQFNKRKGQA